MNKDKAIIVAKTIDNPSLKSIGLVPNSSAYRMHRYDVDGKVYYQIYSGLPCSWVGTHTPVSSTELNNILKKDSNVGVTL